MIWKPKVINNWSQRSKLQLHNRHFVTLFTLLRGIFNTWAHAAERFLKQGQQTINCPISGNTKICKSDQNFNYHRQYCLLHSYSFTVTAYHRRQKSFWPRWRNKIVWSLESQIIISTLGIYTKCGFVHIVTHLKHFLWRYNVWQQKLVGSSSKKK